MSTLTHCKISEKTQVLALRGRPPLPSSSSTTLYAPPPTIVRASGHTPLLVPVGALPLEGCGGGSKKPPWPPLTYSTISCPLPNVTSCLSSVCLHRTYHNLTCWVFFPLFYLSSHGYLLYLSHQNVGHSVYCFLVCPQP